MIWVVRGSGGNDHIIYAMRAPTVSPMATGPGFSVASAYTTYCGEYVTVPPLFKQPARQVRDVQPYGDTRQATTPVCPDCFNRYQENNPR